jgi:hypothetical protein
MSRNLLLPIPADQLQLWESQIQACLLTTAIKEETRVWGAQGRKGISRTQEEPTTILTRQFSKTRRVLLLSPFHVTSYKSTEGVPILLPKPTPSSKAHPLVEAIEDTSEKDCGESKHSTRSNEFGIPTRRNSRTWLLLIHQFDSTNNKYL